MLSRRLVPCLDVRDGQVVKGVRFRDHVVVGAIEELALRYRNEGADELVFYDITASPQGRSVDRDWVERVSRIIDIPFCVAGGIRSVADARVILNAGADKISVNTPALERPALVAELADAFGVQCVVVGIDSLRDEDGDWRVRAYTGDPERMRAMPRRTLDWVEEVQRLGAGEIVLNCMGADGVRAGYDLRSCRRSGNAARCPWWPRAAPACRRISATCSSMPTPMRRWRPVSSIPARSGSPNSSSTCEGRAWRCVMNSDEIDRLAWEKQSGLIPAVVQDARNQRVLMLGYMSREALARTLSSGRVCFYSRSRKTLWMKGESSGDFLELVSLETDCDRDTLLVQALPHGPTCHLKRASCFPSAPAGFLAELDALVRTREAERPAGSYTTRLFESGTRRIAQKVGEEGVETALAAVAQDGDALLGEGADLVFHLMVLLRARGLGWDELLSVLATRHRPKAPA